MKQFSTWDACYYVYMDCLYLEPEMRGKNIGKQLMKRIESYAKSMNCASIQWQTPISNHKAIQFYDGYGATSLDKKRYFLELK